MDNDFAQLAALRSMRCNTVACKLRQAKFDVDHVEVERDGYIVYLHALPRTDAIIRDHVARAGYDLRRYGAERGALVLVVAERAEGVQK